ncbi:L,D-transpeptidase [Xanthobacter variabilis]|uniref:L,D-transpeptidase n=1 Tax=Xanthobacter variabilis TaxID=3119932 RepID=UPI00374EE27A
MMWRAAGALVLGLALTGCMSEAYAPAPTTAQTARDKQLLANAPYPKVKPEGQFARHEVEYTTNKKAGTIVVDTPNKFLYLVEGNGKAIRYGVTVGEESLAFRGSAKVGRKTEWPSWTPTPEIHQRIAGLPSYVAPGPHNPMGARALYLYQGSTDTLFRIHGTNQPELLGQAISSGCIRMLNEDVIDLYSRVPVGTEVVVL